METKVKLIMDKLTNNNIQCFYAEKKEETLDIIKTLINEGTTVRAGGSTTLKECGITNFLSEGNYSFKAHQHSHNHNEPHDNSDDLAAFSCDTFLTGCNAITEEGELFNVDGTGNRVAPMIYGSRQVVMVLGINKIVKDIPGAIHRLKTIAAPLNAKRINKPLYCAKAGVCISIAQGKTGFTDGCDSDERICSIYSVIARQNMKQKDRIKVIIVGESLGL